MNKQIKWHFYIFLSVFNMFLTFICFYISAYLMFFAKAATSPFGQKKDIATLKDWIFVYRLPVAIILLSLGAFLLLLNPILTKKRQAARDEAEYNEDGISRKRASFSQLSKSERDEIERQLMIDRQRILPDTLLKSITHHGPDNADKELDSLIALDNVKNEVNKMKARMEFELNGDFEQKKFKKKKKIIIAHDSMNMIFMGAPGTGKTTIARILTSIFYNYGYITKNQCIEVDGNFFNGLSTGESSKRATALIKAAKGGVLFIDEAYSLLSAGGQEVIATIVKAMEDYRDSIIFIFAGYKNEMKSFINSNPGIESRIKYMLHFNDYSSEELKDVFNYMANQKNMYVDYQALNKAINILEKQKRTNKNFGNARAVRTLLDKTIDNHAFNYSKGLIQDNDKYKIMTIDVLEEK